MKAQVLDSMDIGNEHGITIKAQTAASPYKSDDGEIYHLNLIDTRNGCSSWGGGRFCRVGVAHTLDWRASDADDPGGVVRGYPAGRAGARVVWLLERDLRPGGLVQTAADGRFRLAE